MKFKLRIFTQLATVFLLAYGLKSFYSTASVDELRWILAPTTFFVELITGRQFAFESQAGYMSSDHTFLIAASCSGLNFLIISFLVLALGTIWRERSTEIEWRFLVVSALTAYVATLAANTTRIVVALYSQSIQTTWRYHGELHRIQGIVIYFGFLLALFFWNERYARQDGNDWNLGLIVKRRSAYLLAIYYAVTLGIPVARGSYHEPAFWQHSIVVVSVPLGLILPFLIYATITNSRRTAELS